MATVRLAEILGSLSLATDLSTAHPVESGLGATIVATRLARLAGVPDEQLPATYYACLTRMIGCTATSSETAAASLGRDQLFNLAVLSVDWLDLDRVSAQLQQILPEGDAPGSRDRAIHDVIEGYEAVAAGAAMHCAQAMMLTSRLPLPHGVPDLLSHQWARWDGRYPGAAGADIPLPARVIPLARAADLARRSGGTQAALAAARERRGSEFDPELVDLLLCSFDEVFGPSDDPSRWDAFLDAEPGPVAAVEGDDLTTVAKAFADFVDQKSGWLAGHSRRVSQLAEAAAEHSGLGEDERTQIRLAGLLHDVGRAAVHNGIWDKQGTLSAHERQLAESHNYHTENVLRRSPTLAALAGPASMAHERADGSGYHRNHRAVDPLSGILGAADVYDALVNERPWRPAMTHDEAFDELRSMSTSGALHPECTAAVLTAAGGGETVEPEYPVGLTGREVDVIRLLVTGMPTKTIAARLSISPKTADKHIQSVYDKTDARGRAPVALFAVEHGLLTR